MRKYFLLLSISVISLYGCNTNIDTRAKSEKESYELTKEDLLKKEQKDPQIFLGIKGNNKKNILGQTVVRGVINNKATIAVYKDIDVKLYFYSKTRALLETDRETIYETLEPGKSRDFKTKYFAPKGTDSVGLEVWGAKVVVQPEQKK